MSILLDSDARFWDDNAGEPRRIFSTLASIVVRAAGEGSSSGGDVLIAPGKSVQIYADEVELAGNISLPGKQMEIYCRTLRVAEKAKAVIDVSGAGASPDEPEVPWNLPAQGGFDPARDQEHAQSGKPGRAPTHFVPKDGAAAGTIVIVADRLLLEGTLELRARGGAGGRGMNGENGGDGEAGRDGRCTYQDGGTGDPLWCSPVPACGGYGGKGGAAGRGGAGGDGGVIKVHTIAGAPSATGNLVMAKDAVAGGAAGPSGKPGLGGQHGRGGMLTQVVTNGFSSVIADESPLEFQPEYEGAPMPREAGGEAAAQNTAGKEGSIASGAVALAEALSCFDDLFLFKYLLSLRYRYLLLTPRLRAMARGSADPGRQQDEYEAVLGAFAWLRDGLAAHEEDSGTDLSSLRRREIWREARNLFLLLNNKTTAFGTSAEFAPQLGLEAWKGLLQTTLSVFKDVSGVLDRRSAKERDQANDLAIWDASCQKLQDSILLEEEKRKVLRQHLSDALDEYKAIQGGIEAAKDRLRKADVKVKEEITAHFDCPSIEAIFQAAEMLVFEPKAAMAAVQFGKLAFDGFLKITDASGNAVDKSLLYDELATATDDLRADGKSAFDAQYEVKDGKVVRKNDRQKMVLAKIDKLNQQLQGLKAKIPAVAQFQSALDALKDGLVARSDVILRYNATVQATQESIDREAKVAAELAAMRDRIAASDPMLPADTSRAALLLQALRESALRSLYVATRAATFATLDPDLEREVFDSFATKALWGGAGIAPPAFDLADLEGAFDKLEGKFTDARDRVGRDYDTFPGNGMDSAVVAVVDDASVLDDFRHTRTLEITLVPATATATATDEIALPMLANARDVRAHFARPRLIGASVTWKKPEKHPGKPPLITVLATRWGRERLQSPLGPGEWLVFDRQAIDAAFTYDPHAKPGKDFGQLGTGSLGDGDAFVSGGLFGTWTIEVPTGEGTSNAEVNVDLGKLSRVEIEFGGKLLPKAY